MLRTSAVAIASLVIVAGCSSDSDTSAESNQSAACTGLVEYQRAVTDKINSFGPDIQEASGKKRKKAESELLDTMVEQTRQFREDVSADAGEDVDAAFGVLVSKLEEEAPADDPDAQTANTTIANYLRAECPDQFSPSGAPAPAPGEGGGDEATTENE